MADPTTGPTVQVGRGKTKRRPGAARATSAAKASGLGALEFRPVRPRRVFEEIILQVRRELTLGNLRPGDRLPAERELARQFGASRNAVREALRTLENAGIIVSHKGVNGGAFVRQAEPGQLTQLLSDMMSLGSISLESLTEARVHILSLVVDLATRHATGEHLASLENAVDLAETHTADFSLQRRQDAIGAFYDYLAQATGNEVLVMLVRSITEIVRTVLLDVAPAPRAGTAPAFRQVIAAMRRRDAAEASRLMREHLAELHVHLLQSRDAVGPLRRAG